MLARTPWTLILLRTADDSARLQAQAAKAKAALELGRMNKERLDVLVGRTAAILRTGDLTLFAHEAACRHGMRSAFCLDGRSWALADAMAASIVDKALKRIGASRPTWQDGQPLIDGDDLTEWHYCKRCGTPLPAGHRKWCSDLCMKSHYNEIGNKEGARLSRVEWLAKCVAKTIETKERIKLCEHCGEAFNPGHYHKTLRFCSTRCSTLAREPVTRVCEHCGGEFKTIARHARFCSKSCRGKAKYHRDKSES